MKRIFPIKLPDKRKVPLGFTLSGLRLVLWSSIILLLSITKCSLEGVDRYIFFMSLVKVLEYILLSLSLVLGGGFFLDYIFCKSDEI